MMNDTGQHEHGPCQESHPAEIPVPPAFLFKTRLADLDRPTANNHCLEVMLFWREALMNVRHFSTPQTVTVGAAAKADLSIANESFGDRPFELIRRDGDGQLFLHWSDAMGVTLWDRAGAVRQLDAAEGASGHPIGLHERLAVQVGEITVVVQQVSPVRVRKQGLLHTIDYVFTQALGLSLAVHVALVAVLLLAPIAPQALPENLEEMHRGIRIVLARPRPPEKAREVVFRPTPAGGMSQGEAGAIGTVDSIADDAGRSRPGSTLVDARRRENDMRVVARTGVLGALSNMGAAAARLFGPNGLGDGVNEAMGGLARSGDGNRYGIGGLSAKGLGPGAGGDSMGIGSIGHGPADGVGDSPGVALGPRGPSVLVPNPPHSEADCISRGQVERVLSRLQSPARNCYEQQLQRNPNLNGKVVTSFVIDREGRVESASVAKTTLDDERVEGCLLRVLRRQTFPKCEGGTAEVTYAWIFKSID